jgi:hypothetical protein
MSAECLVSHGRLELALRRTAGLFQRVLNSPLPEMRSVTGLQSRHPENAAMTAFSLHPAPAAREAAKWTAGRAALGSPENFRAPPDGQGFRKAGAEPPNPHKAH